MNAPQAREDSLPRIASRADIPRLREIVLHPSVGHGFFVDGARPEDFDFETSLEKAMWILWEGGAFYVVDLDPTCVEAHIAVLPDFRGTAAIEAAEFAAFMLFTRFPIDVLLGRTPLVNRSAQVFNALCGFRPIVHTERHRIWSLTFLDWLLSRQDPEPVLEQCVKRGQAEKAERARRRMRLILRQET